MAKLSGFSFLVLLAACVVGSCNASFNLRGMFENAALNVAAKITGGKTGLPDDLPPIGIKNGKKGFGKGENCPNDEEMAAYVGCLASDVGGIQGLVDCIGCANMEPHKNCNDKIYEDVGYCQYCAIENPDVECKLCGFTSKKAYKKFCAKKN